MVAEAEGVGTERAPDWWTWGLSIANAILGHDFHEQESGFAIPLAFYAGNRPLAPQAAGLAAHRQQPTGRLCILVHGLGCHEGIWRYREPGPPGPSGEPALPGEPVTYGTLLQRDLGFAPLYVRYNTGRSIAHNGHDLAAVLAALVESYPASVTEIVLIGHSMGGLLIRAACHLGEREGVGWVPLVSRCIYLGTPHSGADLETLTHVAATVLHAVPNPITRLIGRVFDRRSDGIKDLRHGFRPPSQAAAAVEEAEQAPWLRSARHYFVAGSVAESPSHMAARLLGDGLVRQGSAVKLAHGERVPHMDARVLPRLYHGELARSPAVYEQIQVWCSS